jgi:hypothetical protein
MRVQAAASSAAQHSTSDRDVTFPSFVDPSVIVPAGPGAARRELDRIRLAGERFRNRQWDRIMAGHRSAASRRGRGR